MPPPAPASPLIAAVTERQFGWDPLLGVCGLTASAPRERLVWLLTTQLFWTLLAVAATTVCALTTTVYLYRQKVRPPPPPPPPGNSRPPARSPCSPRSALALSRTRIPPRRRASRTYQCSTATARRSGSSTAARPQSQTIVSQSTVHSGTSCCASVGGAPSRCSLCVNPLTDTAVYPMAMILLNLVCLFPLLSYKR